MWTGEQLGLQANLRDQLRLDFEMTPIADAVLELRYDPSAMLCSHLLIPLVELPIQGRDGVLPVLLLSHEIASQQGLFLLDLPLLLCQLLQCCLYTLLLHSGSLTLLIGHFHERQKLVFERLEALLA